MLTLLFQTRPGLEVCPGKSVADAAGALDESMWRAVAPLPGALTCNVGALLVPGRLRERACGPAAWRCRPSRGFKRCQIGVLL